MKLGGIIQEIMLLVTPTNNNRWVYTMHGLEKPMDHVSGNLCSFIIFCGLDLEVGFQLISSAFEMRKIFIFLMKRYTNAVYGRE